MNTLPDTRAQFEDALTHTLPRHVNWLGIELLGQVMLGGITLPEAIQTELNLAQQAQIRARTKADVLNMLKEVLGTQPARAWEHVIEAELVDAMARNGVPVYLPYSTDWGMKTVHSKVNGKATS